MEFVKKFACLMIILSGRNAFVIFYGNIVFCTISKNVHHIIVAL